MKILHVIASLAPCYGGPSTTCPAICREFVRRGHKVTVYTTNGEGNGFMDVPLDRPVVRDGFSIQYFPAWRFPWEYKFSPALLRALRTNVREFDLAHIWSVYCFSSAAGVHACRRSGVPYLLQPHGSLDPYLLARHSLRKWLYTRLVAGRSFQYAAAILFNSAEELQHSANWLAENGLTGAGRESPELAMVPPPLDGDWLAPGNPEIRERFLEKFPELAGKKIVLFFGRLSFKKGMDILAEAFAQVARGRDDIHLLLAGPDTEGLGEKIRAQLQRAGVIEKATFTGVLAGEERCVPMRLASVFVLPSYGENFGQAVAEAMACGVPVVISDKVNLWPEVQQAGAGLVVACDAHETAKALLVLLRNPTLGKEMGAYGRQWVEKHLTWRVVGDQMERLYEQLVRAKTLSGALPSLSGERARVR